MTLQAVTASIAASGWVFMPEALRTLQRGAALSWHPANGSVRPSQARVHGLAFKSEDAEDELVDTAQWFTRDEPFQCFDTEREFA